jgi:hypothetical protein
MEVLEYDFTRMSIAHLNLNLDGKTYECRSTHNFENMHQMGVLDLYGVRIFESSLYLIEKGRSLIFSDFVVNGSSICVCILGINGVNSLTDLHDRLCRENLLIQPPTLNPSQRLKMHEGVLLEAPARTDREKVDRSSALAGIRVLIEKAEQMEGDRND